MPIGRQATMSRGGEHTRILGLLSLFRIHPDIRTLSDLKQAHLRQVRLRRRLIVAGAVFFLVAAVFAGDAFSSVAASLILPGLFILMLWGYRRYQLHRFLAGLDEGADSDVRRKRDALQATVDDVARRMEASPRFTARIIEDMSIAARTTVPGVSCLKSPYILFHDGLLRILSKDELAAVISHEIGHHLVPAGCTGWLAECWADHYACRYGDPVALANALLKIDQNLYLMNVYVRRAAHLAAVRIPVTRRDEAFWEFVLANAPLPFASKREARREARRMVDAYLDTLGPDAGRTFWRRRLAQLRQWALRPMEIHRKRLSTVQYVDWRGFDHRIPNNYLDKYELLDLRPSLENHSSTLSRFHFFDAGGDSHPNTNRRLRFIIDGFLMNSV